MGQLLADIGWEVTPTDNDTSPAEDGETFEANALIKARASQKEGFWTLADDSGLCVDALEGAPGVDTATYGGWPKLIETLKWQPERAAQFVCVLTLLSPDGEVFVFKGTCSGTIAEEGRGSGTFGYDPVFIPQGDTRTFAEMTPEEKHSFSHRGIAVQKLKDWWERRA